MKKEVKNTTEEVKQEGEFKIKKRPKQLVNKKKGPIKVDLSKTKEKLIVPSSSLVCKSPFFA